MKKKRGDEARAPEPLKLDHDPRTKDRANWQRLRSMVEHEACHPYWGCSLYLLYRTGRISGDQREAGDKYTKLVRERRGVWKDLMGSIEVYRDRGLESLERRSALTKDVEFAMATVIANAREPETKAEASRAEKVRVQYREAAQVAGAARSILEDLLIHETWPVGERGHREISHALTRLSHFFNTGTKRKH